MLDRTFVYFVSIGMLLLLILFQKRKSLEKIIYGVLVHLVFTIVIAQSLFPMIIQKTIIKDGVYLEKIQTLELFHEIQTILSLKLSKTQTFTLLENYLQIIVLPLILMGISVGLIIRVKVKNRKKFVLISMLSVVAIQLLKLGTCVLIGANYIQVTPEDGIYIFSGCLIGAGVLSLIQKIICNVEYKSRFFSALKNVLLG